MLPIWSWVLFFTIISISILIDLRMTYNSKSSKISISKAATIMTMCWIALAAAFCMFIYWYMDSELSLLFAAGYLVELSLSIDNIFVFILIFKQFRISTGLQHKILIIGVISAIIMRFIMIKAGTYLIQKFEWIFYVFGIFLIYSSCKIILAKNETDAAKRKSSDKLIAFFSKFLPITDGNYKNKLIVKINGKIFFTTAFIVLVMIEKVDLIFALDSIPAILAITDNIFIVFTSNIFAVLGLRSMYFFLSAIMDKFYYIKYALSVILFFIGSKMIMTPLGYHISIATSLGIIGFSILIAILLSIIRFKKQPSIKEI
jgi:tellurite resistance protein TerC